MYDLHKHKISYITMKHTIYFPILKSYSTSKSIILHQFRNKSLYKKVTSLKEITLVSQLKKKNSKFRSQLRNYENNLILLTRIFCKALTD